MLLQYSVMSTRTNSYCIMMTCNKSRNIQLMSAAKADHFSKISLRQGQDKGRVHGGRTSAWRNERTTSESASAARLGGGAGSHAQEQRVRRLRQVESKVRDAEPETGDVVR